MTNAELSKVVDEQQKSLSYITNRLSELADELGILKGDINSFKSNVSNDMKRVVKTLQTR